MEMDSNTFVDKAENPATSSRGALPQTGGEERQLAGSSMQQFNTIFCFSYPDEKL